MVATQIFDLKFQEITGFSKTFNFFQDILLQNYLATKLYSVNFLQFSNKLQTNKVSQEFHIMNLEQDRGFTSILMLMTECKSSTECVKARKQ